MKQYDLYWKGINIGYIIETNWDMRSSGTILYKFDFLAEFPQNTRLADFIQLSIKLSNYLEDGDEENYNKMSREEIKYLDMVNSPDWQIINEKGETQRILCPIFHDNNEITWQTILQ